MHFRKISIKPAVSAMVMASALAFGGAGTALAQTPVMGETSVDSGLIGGGSNHGLHPNARSHEARQADDGYAMAHSGPAPGNISVDSAIPNSSGSNHGMHPQTHAPGARRIGNYYGPANGRLASGEVSIDSAISGDQVSNHGMTPNAAGSGNRTDDSYANATN